MSNILNHNRILIDFILNDEDYWDFHLSQEMGYGDSKEGLTTECLSAYIDFNDPNCISWDDVFSKEEYIWKDAINNGVTLNSIGVTGVDNGFISYSKDRISNKEFLKLFLESKYDMSEDGLKFHMRKVNGNNQLYDYSNNIVNIDGKDVSELNGGFYQGFFKIQGQKYQTLPYVLEDGWSLEVKLRREDLHNEKLTINDIHPDNKGIFLYIGTRAENKWWEKYLVKNGFEDKHTDYTEDVYIENGYTTDDGDVNSNYIIPDEKDYLDIVYGNDGEHCENEKCNNKPNGESYLNDVYGNKIRNCKDKKCHYVKDDYVKEDYFNNTNNHYNQYVDDDYLEKETEINGNEELYTEDGIEFSQPNMIKYETDNKFLLFNRTQDGFTTKTWEEGTKATIYDIKKPNTENYHLLFNRTENGYTIKNIDGLLDVENKKYNILSDLYRNALAFQIKDDGSIGFKYLIKDCESESENYKIVSLFSKEGVIKNDEWYTVSVKIVPLKPNIINNPICDDITTSVDRKMVIYIYVNGILKLISEELPILNLKALNDLSEKQQGVPFSLSLGGGTQGLCDVVNIDYRRLPKYLLPIEKEFCGSFIGQIESFRFYSCPLKFTEIKENYKYDTNI